MSNPIVFFNVGWMDFYQGPSNDSIEGGGRFIEEKGYGHEIFNFKEHDGQYYGYVQSGSINLKRLGIKWAKQVENVTVIWTATHPDKIGTYIVGWYLNATLYRYKQNAPKKSGRKFNREKFGYFAVTETNEAKLLAPDERLFPVPRKQKDYMGRSNIWYAENVPDFVESVKDYIATGILPNSEAKTRDRKKQNDPLKRVKVEKAAVQKVIHHYTNLGYHIKSVEKDNVGWDLTANSGEIKLKLEVKGLSGSEINTELTPNEYYHLKKDKEHYRVCIVTKALKKKPKLRIFRFSNEIQRWISKDGRTLQFNEIIGTKISG